MKPNDVIEQLKELGVDISRETLRRWVNANLIPEPERGNLGRGQGRYSEYPQETVWEAFAAWHLLKEHSIKQVVEIREKALRFIPEFCFDDMEYFIGEAEKWQASFTDNKSDTHSVNVPELYEYEVPDIVVDDAIFKWLILRIKAEREIPVVTPIAVYIDYYGYWSEKEWETESGNYTEKFPCDVEYNGKVFYVDWYINSVQRYEKGEVHIYKWLGRTEDDLIETFTKFTPDGLITVRAEPSGINVDLSNIKDKRYRFIRK